MSARRLALLDEAAEDAPDNTIEAATRVFQASKSPIQRAFVARCFNALARLLPELDEHSLGNAAGASSDYATLLQALEDPNALATLKSEDPLAAARIRGLRSKERLLEAAGGTISADEVSSLLHISRQAVDKRRQKRQLIGLYTGRHGYAYPLCQFNPLGGTVAGLETVLQDLDDLDPWMALAFLLNPNTRLKGESPLAELHRGNLEEVRRAARTYGEQGAD